MSKKPKFDYGEIVKLISSPKDSILKSGNRGIIWAVYESVAQCDYEGTFWNDEQESEDMWFEENDVEKVSKIEDIYFPTDMKTLWKYLNQNTKIKE